ncbi:uncharacterized protein E5676_scaffold403G001610 [Cucumis melo var. makuwa]|uniref:Ty3-gypsy retrotransposon protein n=1 Tax=Cucumis melo var. makuwa TaxID=1194695 RepID=A0A5D3DZN2_CUCMM|nr:uncharacterized protein E5676_scaffold403G001610 [Cucumis melo var. makuwa]
MLFITDDEVELEEEGEPEPEVNEIVELKTMELREDAEISLRSLQGFFDKGTIKLKGKIKGREVVILIHSGATHNFIHQKIVWELDLLVIEGYKFGVTIGDETTISGKGISKTVKLVLTEVTFKANFLAINLGQ